MVTDAIRVLVAANHTVVRRGLAALLLGFDDLQLAGEARNAAETLEICAALRPDVVLLDLQISDMDCSELTGAICELLPGVHVFLLTAWDEHAIVMRAMAKGAERYLLKDVSGEDLAGAIRGACHTRIPATGLPEIAPDLTDREIEVLQWMALGLTNPQIGLKLVLSRATVKYYVSSILRKLDVASRTEAVVIGMQNNLISAPSNNHAAVDFHG
jgi:DNA-binding NarL/FixJ family response regulator